MNLIEHCWDALDSAVRRRDVKPTTLNELDQSLTEEWAALSQRHINKLVESVPRRIQEVVVTPNMVTRLHIKPVHVYTI